MRFLVFGFGVFGCRWAGAGAVDGEGEAARENLAGHEASDAGGETHAFVDDGGEELAGGKGGTEGDGRERREGGADFVG